MDTTLFLIMLDTLCGGSASAAGTAYMECQPEVGEYAYCPGEVDPEEADCVVTFVGNLSNGRSIVRWEHAK